jgi:hypothetical protein
LSPRNFAQYCQAERQPGPHPLRPGPGPARRKSQPLHLVRALQAEQLRAEKGSS